MTTRYADHVLGPDTHANRPAATAVPEGCLYACTTHALVYKSDGATWSTYFSEVAGALVVQEADSTVDAGVSTIDFGHGFDVTSSPAGEANIAVDESELDQALLGGTSPQIAKAIIDAKGDLIVGTAADTAARKAVGADGKILVADSSQGDGLRWGGQEILFARKTGDQSSSSTSFADVTDLTFAVAANTIYRFRFVIHFNTSATTEGCQFSVNGPSGTYRFGGFVPASTPTAGGSAILHSSAGAADSAALVPNAGPGNAGGVATMAIIEGIASIGGSGGTLALRFRAETGGGNSVQVLTNSFGEISIIA
jgi:hypothetical protein